MIIDNTYFRGDIYIPHAKPSITDDISGVEDDVLSFIDDYARECLLNCLGYNLFLEFSKLLDSNQTNGLSQNAADKWNYLLNGHEYVCPDTGETKIWRGIRYKSNPAEGYNKSFLAYYVYYYYEQHDYIVRSDAGHEIVDSKNAQNTSPTMKVVLAWNKFVEKVQGGNGGNPRVLVKNGFLLVDHYNESINLDVNLNQFIRDSNKITKDTYKDFKPKVWKRMNRFGI